VIRGQASIIMLVSLLLATTVGLRFWSRRATDGLSYQRSFEPPRIFPGEQTTYVVEMKNEKILPLPWVRIDEHLPTAITPVTNGTSGPPANDGMPRSIRKLHIWGEEGWQRRRSVSLGRNERLVLRQRFTCLQRGSYVVGPTDIETGDPLGMFPVRLRAKETRELVVYPRMAVIPPIEILSRFPFGSTAARPPALEDPARFAGIRDYQAGDPRRWVDWKASARRLKLQTRVFAPTTQPTVIIALNVQTMQYTWQGYDSERLEAAIAVAAACVREALEHRQAVGLAVNTSGTGMEDFQVFLRPNRRPSQLEDALGLLAQLSPLPTMAFGAYVHHVASNVPYGASLLAVTSYLDDETIESLALLAHRGHAVTLCFLGETLPVPVPREIRVVLIPRVELEPLASETLARDPAPEPLASVEVGTS
jgi:uncharacterized protein (DUF58 family)